MKNCTSCGELSNNFSPDKTHRDGRSSQCRACKCKKMTEYAHTKNGLIGKIYSNQRRSSRHRGHEMPTYTRVELLDWCLSQEIFHRLYNEWKKSDYNKNLTPSCDRTDDSKGYSLNRLQLMTWEENKLKASRDMRAGTLINVAKPQKPVAQWTFTGNLVNTYVSILDASRATKLNDTSISRACRGIREHAGGYKWTYQLSST